jgi:uncharacterized membrane protein
MSIGLPGILTIIFVLLKAFGVIDWSWWIVFSPVLISFAVVAVVFVVAAVARSKFFD